MRFLRILLGVHVATAAAQAVFAGQFLSGMDQAVRWHEIAGWSLLALCVAQVAAGFVARAGLPFAVSSALILLAEVLQTGSGYGRFPEVHVPLGALILAGLAAQLVWSLRL